MHKSRVGKLGWMLALGIGLAAPSFNVAQAANSKAAKKASSDDESAASPASTGMSKDDQDKVKEHNKLRAEIKKVKYPAPKATIVAHVKGIKPDDKKWFSETLPEKTYTSADEVYSALGWPETPPPAK